MLLMKALVSHKVMRAMFMKGCVVNEGVSVSQGDEGHVHGGRSCSV